MHKKNIIREVLSLPERMVILIIFKNFKHILNWLTLSAPIDENEVQLWLSFWNEKIINVESQTFVISSIEVT